MSIALAQRGIAVERVFTDNAYLDADVEELAPASQVVAGHADRARRLFVGGPLAEQVGEVGPGFAAGRTRRPAPVIAKAACLTVHRGARPSEATPLSRRRPLTVAA